jgi:transcriptional regulator with XRE-family HTH domain
MLGQRIRQVRQARSLSLNDVATRAKISVATLSRIERGKQGKDVDMFKSLSKIHKTTPHDQIGADHAPESEDALAPRIAALTSRDRIALWHDLSTERSKDRNARKVAVKRVADEVDELLAQIEFLHAEIEAMQKRLRGR